MLDVSSSPPGGGLHCNRRSCSQAAMKFRSAAVPAAASDAWLEARDCSHTARLPTLLRPGTGALRLLAASPRCVLLPLDSEITLVAADGHGGARGTCRRALVCPVPTGQGLPSLHLIRRRTS